MANAESGTLRTKICVVIGYSSGKDGVIQFTRNYSVSCKKMVFVQHKTI